jgi:uncharacterized protein
MSKFDDFIRSYAEGVLKYRWAVLAGAAGLMGVAAIGLAKLEFDTTFRIWHPEDSEQLKTYDERVARFGSDDAMIVIWRDEDGVLTNKTLATSRRLTDAIWKIAGVKRVDALANFQGIRASRTEHESPALATSAKYVAAPGDHNEIMIWDRATWKQRDFLGHEGLVEHLAMSPDGKRLYSASEDRTIRVWDIETGQTVFTLRGAPESISSLVLSQDGSRIYAGSYKSVLAWDTASGKRLWRTDVHEDYVTQVVVAKDMSRVFSASKSIAVHDGASGNKTGSFVGHKQFVNRLVLSPDDQVLYSAGDDGLVASWTIQGGEQKTLLSMHGQLALSLALDAKRSLLIAGLSDGTIRAIPLSGAAVETARLHDDWVVDLAVAADGRVFSASRDRNVALHTPGQGPKALTLQVHRGAVRRVSLEGDRLVTMGDEGDVYVWSVDKQAIEARLYRHKDRELVQPVSFQGPKTGVLNLINSFRYPIEIRVGGQSKGQVLSNASITVAELPVPISKPCDDDSSCGPGEYCDYEQDTPTCTGRTLVEAYVPGSNVRVWAGETFVRPDQPVSLHAPTDEPFSVAPPAEAGVDERARVGALLAAFPKDQALIKAELATMLGADAEDPMAFISPLAAKDLSDKLAAKNASAEVVQFLSTHGQVQLTPNKLPIQPFRLREIGQILTRGPVSVAKGLVLNEARDTTGIFANLHMPADSTNPREEASRVRAELEAVLAEESKVSGYQFHLTGDAIQDTTFEQYARRDISTLFPMFVGMVILVFSFWYRRPAGVFVPLGLVMLAIANTLGISALFGAKLNNMTVAIPQVVLACCVGDLNHVFNGFMDRLRHGEDRHEAVVNTVVFEFVPCFWTASTTALGFFSMIIGSTIVPIATFGWMGGIGAMAAWFGTFTVMPAVLSLLPVPKKLKQETEKEKEEHKGHDNSFAHRMDKRLIGLSRYTGRTAGTLIFMSIVVIGVAAYGLKNRSFDTNSIEFFGETAPFRIACNFAEEHISGPFGISIMVDTKEPGGIRKVKNIEALSKLHAKLAADPEVTTVVGLADIIKNMNRVMNQDVLENYRVPDSDGKVSSYYNAYTFSLPAGQELTNRVSADESMTMIDARIKNHAAGWIINWGTELKDWAKVNVPEVEVRITAKSWLYSHMLSTMAESFFGDVAQAVISISITLFFLARNFRMGWIALLVNLMPLFVTVGFTSLRGKTLDISVLISCSVAMGIVVDDTIHYVAKYRWMRLEGMDHEQTVEFLAQEHSKASLVTALVLIGGFMMFIFTDYQINRNFGITTAIMLLVGTFFDLLILPAMLKIWGPKSLGEQPQKPQVAAQDGHHKPADHAVSG